MNLLEILDTILGVVPDQLDPGAPETPIRRGGWYSWPDILWWIR